VSLAYKVSQKEHLRLAGSRLRFKGKLKIQRNLISDMRSPEQVANVMDMALLSYRDVDMLRGILGRIIPCRNQVLKASKQLLSNILAFSPIKLTVESKPGKLQCALSFLKDALPL